MNTKNYSNVFILFAILVAALLFLISESALLCQEGKWYPSQWGPQDEKGSGNYITPQKVIEGARLIKEGKIYQLGQPYTMGMPLFGSRHYSIVIPQTFGPQGENKLTWHEEVISGELGQIGTEFDALGHVGIGDLYYNGFDKREFAKSYGLEKLGVEKAVSFMTRGVLIDIAGFKGVPRMEKGYEITTADLENALKKEGIIIKQGDVVLINTGWGLLYGVDNAAFNSGQPGLGLPSAQFLIDKKVAMVGSDNWGIEVVPNPDPKLAFPVHQLFLPKNGVHLIEVLNLSELAKDKVYEFCFIYAPLKLKGATGSPGNPIAVK